MGNRMCSKGYGRIYVANASQIQEVKDCIEELDPFEFEYFRDGIIAAYDGNPKLVYTGKFEIDIDHLTQLCWSRGIYTWVISQGIEQYPDQFTKKKNHPNSANAGNTPTV